MATGANTEPIILIQVVFHFTNKKISVLENLLVILASVCLVNHFTSVKKAFLWQLVGRFSQTGIKTFVLILSEGEPTVSQCQALKPPNLEEPA